MNPKNYALWLLGKRAYTEKGLRDKLKSKKYFASDIEIVIKFCKDQRFINDIEYAKSFIRTRDICSPRGKHLLRLELLRKGISRDDIDKVFDDEEVVSRSEIDLARELVRRKARQYDTLSKEKKYQKLFGLLARRGFDLDIIKEVTNEYLKKS